VASAELQATWQEIMAGHVFISHSQKDLSYVGRLAVYLRGNGIPVWLGEDLAPGTPDWVSAIESGIRNSVAVILVMSPNSESSPWVDRELDLAQELGKLIVPLLLSGRPLFRVRNIQFRDVSRGQLPDETLITQLRRLRDPASGQASPAQLAGSPGPSSAQVNQSGAPPVGGGGKRRRRFTAVIVGGLVACAVGVAVVALHLVPGGPGSTNGPSAPGDQGATDGFVHQHTYTGPCNPRPVGTVCLQFNDNYVWLVHSAIGGGTVGVYYYQGNPVEVAHGACDYYHVSNTDLVKAVKVYPECIDDTAHS
jgi:hypothetical protein